MLRRWRVQRAYRRLFYTTTITRLSPRWREDTVQNRCRAGCATRSQPISTIVIGSIPKAMAVVATPRPLRSLNVAEAALGLRRPLRASRNPALLNPSLSPTRWDF